MERREHKRESIQGESLVLVRNRSFPCSIRNISEGGALLQIGAENADPLSQDDIGQEALLEPPGSEGNCVYKGRIIRCVHNGDQVFLALFFI